MNFDLLLIEYGFVLDNETDTTFLKEYLNNLIIDYLEINGLTVNLENINTTKLKVLNNINFCKMEEIKNGLL